MRFDFDESSRCDRLLRGAVLVLGEGVRLLYRGDARPTAHRSTTPVRISGAQGTRIEVQLNGVESGTNELRIDWRLSVRRYPWCWLHL